MVKTNKPESPSAAAAKSKKSKSSSSSPTTGAATSSAASAASSSSSTTTAKAAAATATTTTSHHAIIDPTVSQLHRAWRQFISSFLVAARTQPSATNDPVQAKILRDTIDTNLKARNELRRLLTEMEEHLLGRSAKRKELLSEMLESTPCAIIPKKRRIGDSDNQNDDNMDDAGATTSAPHAQPTDVIDVDAGDLDSFPLM